MRSSILTAVGHSAEPVFIVVLGAGVWPGGAPSPALERRVLHAVGLARGLPGSRLLVTGGLGRHPPSEAEVMQRVAVEAGFPAERVTRESTSHSTLDSAEECAELLRRAGHRGPVILVSDRYHLLRASMAFRLHGVRARTSGPTGPPSFRRSFQEVCKVPWLVLRFVYRRISVSSR